jgi:inner membrane protein
MASVFGHLAFSAALGKSVFPAQTSAGTLLLTGFCAFMPDLDVLAFHVGIPYESQWGHRGFTHSIVFTLAAGAFFALLYSGIRRGQWPGRGLLLWCMLSALSHPLLDMLTNGGRGCALFWPFSEARHFFPFRPILVSPLGAAHFFSEWGLRVLLSELFWIGIPCLGMMGLRYFLPTNKVGTTG